MLEENREQEKEKVIRSEWPAPFKVIGQAFRDWWDDWVNMVVINLIFALAWLTIVFGPPATFGLYYVTHHLARGQSLGIRGLLEGGRRYFIQSWLWFLVNLGVAAVLGANYFFYASLTTVWADYLKAAFVLLGLAWLVVQFYALPFFIAQQEKRVGLAMQNGLFTALAAPGYSLIMASTAGLVAILSIVTIAMIFLGCPCLIAAFGSRAVLDRLKTYQLNEQKEIQ